jgi:Uma2 family endonuclease
MLVVESIEAQQMVQTPVKPLTLAAKTLQGKLIIRLNESIQPVGRSYPELCCTFGGRSIIPRVSVFRSERIPLKANGEIENVFPIAPDWTICILQRYANEILPPSLDIPSSNQQYKKAARNISHCLDHGCQMGWLIDLEEKTVVVMPPDCRSRTFEAIDVVLPVPDWAVGLELTVGEIFGWLVG